MTNCKLNEENKDQLWDILKSANERAAKKRAAENRAVKKRAVNERAANKGAADKVDALAEIQAVIDSYLRDIAGGSPSPPNKARVKGARGILDVLEDLRNVEHTDKYARRLFYKILAQGSGVPPGKRTKEGKKLFRSMRRKLLAAGKATLSEIKEKGGRPFLTPQLIDAMVALARIWKKFTGEEFQGSKQNPYSKNISKRGMSARFVALALELGAGAKIAGNTEHAFNNVKERLKSCPATSAATGSVSASGSGSGSGSSSGGEE